MNAAQTVLEPMVGTGQNIIIEPANETTYTTLPKEEALALTAEVIDKYRPALEKLAE